MSRVTGTRWTLIRAAQEGTAEALRDLTAKYRAPVVAYLASRGAGNEAEDLAQEVFLRLFQDGVLARADPAQGRFRSLVFAVTRNVLGHHLAKQGAKKRGEGKVGRLDDLDVAAPEPDRAFDREWLACLLDRTLKRLEQEHRPYFLALQAYLVEGRTQDEVAQSLGWSKSDVRNRVFRGKRKLIAYLREEVWSYSTSREDYAEELKLLARLLEPSDS